MKRTRFIAFMAAALIAGFVLGGIGVSAAATRTATPAPRAVANRIVASNPPSSVTPGLAQMVTNTPAPTPPQTVTVTPAPTPPQTVTSTPSPQDPRTAVSSTYCAPHQPTTTTPSRDRDRGQYHDGSNSTSRCDW